MTRRNVPPLPLESLNEPQKRIRQLADLGFGPGSKQYWRKEHRQRDKHQNLPDARDVSAEEFWEATCHDKQGSLSSELRELQRRIDIAEKRRPGLITMAPATRMVAGSELARELGVSERRAVEFCASIGVRALDVSGKWYIMVPDLEYCVWVATRREGTDTSYPAFLQWAQLTGSVYAGLKRLAVQRRLAESAITDRPGKIVRRGRRRVRVAETVAGLPLVSDVGVREIQ